MKRALVVISIAVFGSAFAFAADAPNSVTLNAKNGKVTFNHKAHADKLKCGPCHGEGTPGKMAPMGKDKAHGLCMNCHKEQKAGPTKCGDCHKK